MNHNDLKKCAARTKIAVLSTVVMAGCAVPAPKYENGQYIPPPAEHALGVELSNTNCSGSKVAPMVGAVLAAVGPALVNYGFDQFVNWLDNKAANLSASSTGVTTTTLYDSQMGIKRCLTISRSDNLVAKFDLQSTSARNVYWHMTPYSLEFKRSEAKEVFSNPGMSLKGGKGRCRLKG